MIDLSLCLRCQFCYVVHSKEPRSAKLLGGQKMYEIAVIGAGPAGASAALFAAKAGKKTLLIDNDKGMTRRG